MSKRDIGLEILDGIKEIKEYNNGEGSLKGSKLSEPPQVMRSKLEISQYTRKKVGGLHRQI